MLRIALLSVAATFLFVTGAAAHGYHASCASGPYHSGNGPHYHPGGTGQAVPCGGGGYRGGHGGGYGGGGGYYRPGYGGGYYGGGGRPGDYGPQTNWNRDCYNVHGRRICCPKGWTVQGGQCKPYRGY